MSNEKILIELVEKLENRQREVLKLKYGLDDGKERTNEEVSKLLNLSIDAVKEAEVAALRKLREPDFYTVKEAAKYLMLHEVTVRKHLETGKLKGYKAGNRWRIKQEDLEKYLEGKE